ncbi:MAG: hypothetical protein IH619_03615 [Ignavibacterium sp.]|nr:hypothetical protein [Ignavibacterium sp.]
MKKIFSLFLMISALIAFSCSDNATGPTTGGIGGGIGGGGNTGGVTYTVSLAQDNQQQYYFEFKPSVDAVITTITANCAAANVNNEQVTDDGTTVYNANNPAYVGPITILAQGQQWTFTIAGKLGSSTGTAYSATANFTVQ